MICDSHTHSNNSFDAKSTVEEMCRAAISQNLYAITITDHCEAPFIRFGADCEFGCFDDLIPKSLEDTARAAEQFSGKLKVLRGLELGEPVQDSAGAERALSYGEYDFILASVHGLKNMLDFYYLDYTQTDIGELLKKYFTELCETAQYPHFDSLAHLTYPLRYIIKGTGKMPDLSLYSDMIDDIFKILIKNNKALEINVSGLFKELNSTMPDVGMVRRFKELGGKYITVGTDAHSADAVGKGLKQGLAVAIEAGFTHYALYEKHVPKLIPINI